MSYSLNSTLFLTILLAIGLFFFLRASSKDRTKAAIASSLSAKTYNLEILNKNIENEKGNLTRFLVMGKNVSQPEYGKKKYITSFLFKLINLIVFRLESFLLAVFNPESFMYFISICVRSPLMIIFDP